MTVDRESLAEEVYQQLLSSVWIMLIGGIAAAAMMLIGRSVIANLFSPAVYGAFGIGFTVLAFVSVTYRGLGTGLSRQISYAIEDEEDPEERIRGYVSWAIVVAVVSSLILLVLVSFFASAIASTVFQHPSYASAIRLMVLGLPALALIELLSNVIRGYNEAFGRVIFEDIMRTFVFPVAASILAGVLTDSPDAAYLAYPAALWITAVWNTWYILSYRDIPWSFTPSALRDSFSHGVEVVRFSAPLVLSFFLLVVMLRSDVFLLGILSTPTQVGFYEVVRPILNVPLVVWGAMIWLYTPLVSAYTANDDKESTRRVYIAMTKWFTLFTYPFLIVAALFPTSVITVTFGQAYAPAAPALRIVAVGVFLGNLLGPTGATMTAIGKTRELTIANSLGAAGNIIFNLLLIPQFGIIGAAIGTIIAESFRNLARVYVLDDYGGIHAFRTELYVPLLVTSALLVVVRQGLAVMAEPSPFVALLFVPLAFFTYLSSYVATRSVNKDDKEMLMLLQERLGIADQTE